MFPFDNSCFFDPVYNIAKIVAIAAATTATQRWTGSACGRQFRSVRERSQHWVVVVRSQCAKVVPIATATTATQRWTGSTCSRRLGLVRGRGWQGVVVIRSQCARIVAIATATTATQRWVKPAAALGCGPSSVRREGEPARWPGGVSLRPDSDSSWFVSGLVG
jgi:hypothetical protein